MPEITSREIRLKRRPTGLPGAGDFELAEVRLPEPESGELLVRNIYMSVDPYMRGRMREQESYTPAFRLGEPLSGGAVGEVVRSRHDGFRTGDFVLNQRGWREYFLSTGSGLTKVDPALAPLRAYLGVLGMPGMTAYVGLLDIGQPQAGETVFVSAASGAVGSVVCQIAKIKGCRVVGSAGSDEKVAWLLDDAGIDAAINYKRVDDLAAALREGAPDGIDLYFDNVGGAHLQAALGRMNNFGRIVLCGMIARYNDPQPEPGPNNLMLAVSRRLRLQGFIVSDHYDRLPQFHTDMATWIAQGRIKWHETVVEGIEQTPAAFVRLFSGEKLGKMLVQIGPDPTAA
jgi:NADPH-dependent curcumin reductase CurA